MRVGTIVAYAACAVAAVSGSGLRAPQEGRENPEFAKPISENQVTTELENEVAKAASVLNDGQEFDHNQAKNIYNGVISGWGKPNMVPTGYFKNAAGETVLVNNKPTANASDVPTYKPFMIPIDGFKKRAEGLPKPSGLYKPEKMVEHGKLREMKLKEEAEDNVDDEDEAELREKAAKVRSEQQGPACGDMEKYLELARAVRKEEELAGDGKTRKGLVNLVKMVCPVLKSEYGFVMRCTSCERMMKRLELFYGDYEQKAFPGKKHPSRCDQSKWPLKNFVLEAALSSPNVFFGVDFCESSEEVASNATAVTEF